MKFILTYIFTILILLGCQEISNVTDPLNDNNSNILEKNPSVQQEYEMILLPPKAPEWQGVTFSVSKEINGNVGGEVRMFEYYITDSGLPFFIYVKLEIPKKAFHGTKTITMTLDDEYASIHFDPGMNFKKDLILNQYFQGIDLFFFRGNYMEEMDFVFIDDDGNIEMMERNGVTLNKQIGLIEVLDAKIPHFSRFGWVRKQASGI